MPAPALLHRGSAAQRDGTQQHQATMFGIHFTAFMLSFPKGRRRATGPFAAYSTPLIPLPPQTRS